MHGHEVPISFENIQVILKFSLLFDIDDLTKLAENWLKYQFKKDTEKITENTGKTKDITNNNGDKEEKNNLVVVADSKRIFVKILKIGLEIKHFCPVFEMCSKEYQSYSETYVNLMKDEFTNISKPFVRFLLRNQKTFKCSIVLLELFPKSHDNVNIILEILNEYIDKNNSLNFTYSSEIVSLLDLLSESDILNDTLKKITRLYSKPHCKQSYDLDDIIREKPWRKLLTVKDLFEFRELHVSISEYMYIEMIIDWLKCDDNHKSLYYS